MSRTKKILNPEEHIKDLENMINDLTFIIALRNADDPIINKAYRLIGTPIDMIEMGVAIKQHKTIFGGFKYVTQ